MQIICTHVISIEISWLIDLVIFCNENVHFAMLGK